MPNFTKYYTVGMALIITIANLVHAGDNDLPTNKSVNTPFSWSYPGGQEPVFAVFGADPPPLPGLPPRARLSPTQSAEEPAPKDNNHTMHNVHSDLNRSDLNPDAPPFVPGQRPTPKGDPKGDSKTV